MAEKVVILGSFAESLVRFRGSLIAALVKEGHEVVACAPDITVELEQRLSSLGARVRSVPMKRAGISPLSDLGLLARLVRLLKQERPRVLLAYTIKPVVYAGLAARFVPGIRFAAMITGLGFGLTEGGGTLRRFVAVAARVLYRLALTRAFVVFFQNPDDLAFFRKSGILRQQTPTQLVPGSGIDTEEFQFSDMPSSPRVLMVARLIRDKGVYEYAEAARAVRRRHPAVSFELAGWIDENPTSIRRSELDRWVADGDIRFLGRLDDVRPALKNCSVYVLPSYREGTPRTVLEAMAVGRAVVTTDAPGCRETVDEGSNGYLVPVGDAQALSRRICDLVEAPERARAFGLASRRMAERKFDVRIVNRLLISGMGLHA